jgi:hypothetical protein
MTGALVRGTDESTEGRWLTYDELAKVRGIKRIGAVRLAQRQRWRRQPGNDGKTRVWVPTEALALVRGTRQDANSAPDGAHDSAGNSARDGAGTVAAAFEIALAAIREAKDDEIATLRDTVEGLRGTVSRAEHRAVHAEDRANRAEAEAREAQDAAEELRRRERDWWGQGRLRRVLAAWRGE